MVYEWIIEVVEGGFRCLWLFYYLREAARGFYLRWETLFPCRNFIFLSINKIAFRRKFKNKKFTNPYQFHLILQKKNENIKMKNHQPYKHSNHSHHLLYSQPENLIKRSYNQKAVKKWIRITNYIHLKSEPSDVASVIQSHLIYTFRHLSITSL